jgi:hypothetical protein
MFQNVDWRKVAVELWKVLLTALCAAGACTCAGCLSRGSVEALQWENELQRRASIRAHQSLDLPGGQTQPDAGNVDGQMRPMPGLLDAIEDERPDLPGVRSDLDPDTVTAGGIVPPA